MVTSALTCGCDGLWLIIRVVVCRGLGLHSVRLEHRLAIHRLQLLQIVEGVGRLSRHTAVDYTAYARLTAARALLTLVELGGGRGLVELLAKPVLLVHVVGGGGGRLLVAASSGATSSAPHVGRQVVGVHRLRRVETPVVGRVLVRV